MNPLVLKVGLGLVGLCITGYILGPPLYWHFMEGLAAVSHSSSSSSYSCSPCQCDCSSHPLLSIPEGTYLHFHHSFTLKIISFFNLVSQICLNLSAFSSLIYFMNVDLAYWWVFLMGHCFNYWGFLFYLLVVLWEIVGNVMFVKVFTIFFFFFLSFVCLSGLVLVVNYMPLSQISSVTKMRCFPSFLLWICFPLCPIGSRSMLNWYGSILFKCLIWTLD